jgi:hypothetical protein
MLWDHHKKIKEFRIYRKSRGHPKSIPRRHVAILVSGALLFSLFLFVADIMPSSSVRRVKIRLSSETSTQHNEQRPTNDVNFTLSLSRV